MFTFGRVYHILDLPDADLWISLIFSVRWLLVSQSLSSFFPIEQLFFFSTKSSTKNSSLQGESTESGEIEFWSLISGSTHHDCLDWSGFCCFHFILASAKLLKATEGVWTMFGGLPYSNKLTSHHFSQFWSIRSKIMKKCSKNAKSGQSNPQCGTLYIVWEQ